MHVHATLVKSPAAAAPKKKRAVTGIMMPRPVSPALQVFMGTARSPASSTYIQENNLQVYPHETTQTLGMSL